MVIHPFNPYVFDDVKKLIELTYANQVQDPDSTVIVLGANVAPISPKQFRDSNPGKRLIVYQMEQLFHGQQWLTPRYKSWLLDADEVWDYDLGNLNYLARYLGIDAKYRPMQFHPDLDFHPLPPEQRDIAILFAGAFTDRRLKTLQKITTFTAHGTFAPTVAVAGTYGEHLLELLRRSKIVLNIHAMDSYIRQEQVRIFRPVISGLCVLSESSPLNEFGKSIIEAPLQEIPDIVKSLLRTDDWINIAKNAPETYREHCSNRKSL